MVADLLRFIDGQGWSLPIVLVIVGGVIGGSLVWFARGPGHPTETNLRISRSPEFSGRVGQAPPIGDMSLGEFFSSVTLQSPEGKVVLLGSAANLALAAVLYLLQDRIPNAYATAVMAVLLPLFLFFWHAVSFMYGRMESGWFRTVCLVSIALAPTAKLASDLLRAR